MNPLEQLKDIHMPPPPGFWPLAPGWWILLTITVLALLASGYWYYQRWHKNQYRREAQAELSIIVATGNSIDALPQILALIRRTARISLPETPWVALNSSQLLLVIDNWATGKLALEITAASTNKTSLNEMVNNHYRANNHGLSETQTQILSHHIKRWINKHKKGQLC